MSKLHDKEWVEEQYMVEGKEIAEIAAEVEETQFSVSKWIRRYDFDDYEKCSECGEFYKNLSAHKSVHEESDESDE